MVMPTRLKCPLCRHHRIDHFHTDKKRDYYRCQNCQLVFVPPDQHLNSTQEKAIYDLHKNAINDTGYRRFLSRLFEPLVERLKPGSRGLDFGCGPGPALAAMFTEQGFSMSLFDPFYAYKPEVLQTDYDFICCTEVVEHFINPNLEFQRLLPLLADGGYLGIMTKQVRDLLAFTHWHYKNDLTHVCFFSQATFQWLARQYQCHLEFIGQDVILLKKLSELKDWK